MRVLCREAQNLLDAAQKAGLPPIWTLDPVAARERLHKIFTAVPPPDAQVEAEDCSVPPWISGAPTFREYRPAQSSATRVVLFFHGGGWVVNSIATHDNLCRRLATACRSRVLSLELPLAPERPYPSAIQAAAQWYYALVSSGRIELETDLVLSGDSSGAAIALALCQESYLAPAVKACVSIYPACAHYSRGFRSYEERGTGYNLTAEWMRWFWDYYVHPNVVRRATAPDPTLEPLYATYSHRIRHLVATAEFDPLRDEGSALVERLQKSGVNVAHLHFDDQMHGFVMLPHLLPRATELVTAVGDFVDSL